MTTTQVAVVCDHLKNSSTLPLAAPAPRTDGYSATSDGGRASRLRSPAVANSRGPLGRNYFLDGGCSMPATSAVDPVLPVEGAAPGRADLSLADTVAAICGWAA